MSNAKKLNYIILTLLMGLFVYHCMYWNFTQDDAFISYRYAENLINGDGLVFNPGEYVEGYTNFLFVIILAFFGKFGLDILVVSKILGIASGIAVLILSYLMVKKITSGESIINICPAALLVSSGSFAYWSMAGLETLFFTALILAGIYLYYTNSRIYPVFWGLAALTRPEAIMVFGLLMIFVLFIEKRNYRLVIKPLLLFALIVIPHFLFRIIYYHDIVPNPFYAKTSVSIDSIAFGFDYLWRFLKHYGLYGAIIIVPILSFAFRKGRFGFLILLSLVYTLYIILVGGDVLYGHRFFIPILPILYIVFVTSVDSILKSVHVRKIILPAIVILFLAANLILPYSWLADVRFTEIALVDKMKRRAEYIRLGADKKLTIACSTIGAFGYYSKMNIIDLLGLTDREIAKNPKPFDGIESSWKEQNYNIEYLMNREPDLILFSTGIKPSAPAERALFLSSKFRKGYYPVFNEANAIWAIYRRKEVMPKQDEYFADPAFINYYHTALNMNRDKRYELAIDYTLKAIDSGPLDFYLPYILLGDIKLKHNLIEEAIEHYLRADDLSEGCAVIASLRLSDIYNRMGDSLASDKFVEKVNRYNRLY